MSPAEELRTAAAKIREVADGLPHGPWHVEPLGHGTSHPGYPQRITNAEAVLIAETFVGAHDPRMDCGPTLPQYMALWHPGVAELVAQVLDAAADALSGYVVVPRAAEAWLNLARAINGGGA